MRVGDRLPTLDFRSIHSYSTSAAGIEIPIFLSIGASRSVSVLAKGDTGAAFCIFQREHAEALDVSVENGLPLTLRTATGSFQAFGHVATLSYYEYEFESTVYFAAHYDFPRNVLGLHGWLDKLRFGLIHHDARMLLSHYNDEPAPQL